MSKRQRKSDSSDSEEQEMPKPITLAAIPTLKYLYKNKSLVQSRQRFPHRESLLDRVSLFQGDITRLEVDAIVNAANRSLLGGGGVDGAIHHAAGPGLFKECRTLGGADTGEAKITGGHKLPSKHIIHAVGPIYSSSERDIRAAQLEACYANSMDLAITNQLSSIAFCSISTGVYGYPIVDATHIALQTTRELLEKEPFSGVERVIFVVWSDKDRDVYQALLPEYFPETDIEEPQEVAPQDNEKGEPTLAATENVEPEAGAKEGDAVKSAESEAVKKDDIKETAEEPAKDNTGEAVEASTRDDTKRTIEEPKKDGTMETAEPKKDGTTETAEEPKKDDIKGTVEEPKKTE